MEEGFKYQALLQDYLRLQKEFVSKKKKLQAIKQKRESLLAVVRFLKQKRKHLLKVRSPQIELGNSVDFGRRRKNQIELANSVNSNRKRRKIGMQIAECVNGDSFQNNYPILASNSILKDEEVSEGEKQEISKELGIRKKNIYLIDNKVVGKKKISWQDQVSLKV